MKGKALGLAAYKDILTMVHEHVKGLPQGRKKGTDGLPRQNALAFYRMEIIANIIGCEVAHEQISQYVLYGHSGDIIEAEDSLLYCAGCNYGNTMRMTPWLRVMPSAQRLTALGYAMRRLPLPPKQAIRWALGMRHTPAELRLLITSPDLRTPANTNPVYVRRTVKAIYEAVEEVPHVARYLEGLIFMNDSQPRLIVEVDIQDGWIVVYSVPTTIPHRSLGGHLILKGVNKKK
ncbi:MAG: hypothetical protein D6746_04760 [Bacteroidetes bacterium]|nr:MAG: hypothetical protein D6746_04760 [Bacteroidota bacterium]